MQISFSALFVRICIVCSVQGSVDFSAQSIAFKVLYLSLRMQLV